MISVAMATYNGEKYLKEQLLSILFQTRKPDEIIINDDGSTDHTLELVKQVSEMTEIPIFVEQNEKCLGFAENFRRAIRRTKGDIVFLCDQDDIWVQNKIELCMSVFEERKEVMALSTGFSVIYGNQSIQPVMDEKLGKIVEISWYQFLRHPKYPGMAMAFRKKIWLQIDAMDWGSHTAHDWMINQYAASIAGMYWISNKLVLYRQHSNNTEGMIVNKTRKEIKFKRQNLINSLIDGMGHVQVIDGKQRSFLERAFLFQKKRQTLLAEEKILTLLLYELIHLKYITPRSIVGDLYVCFRVVGSRNE